MAPEAATGAAIGPAYDQYSLAVVVYQALSGELPHTGTNPLQIVANKAYQEPAPLAPRAPNAPAGCVAAVMRALARDPGQRFGSCSELAMAFIENQRSALGIHAVRGAANHIVAVADYPGGSDPIEIRLPDSRSVGPSISRQSAPMPSRRKFSFRRREDAILAVILVGVLLFPLVLGSKGVGITLVLAGLTATAAVFVVPPIRKWSLPLLVVGLAEFIGFSILRPQGRTVATFVAVIAGAVASVFVFRVTRSKSIAIFTAVAGAGFAIYFATS